MYKSINEIKNFNKYFSIGNIEEYGNCIIFKNKIPMWGANSITKEGFKNFQFNIYQPDIKDLDNPNYYFIECRDNLGDHYSFGNWSSEIEILEFINSPKMIYIKKDNEVLAIARTEQELMKYLFLKFNNITEQLEIIRK